MRLTATIAAAIVGGGVAAAWPLAGALPLSVRYYAATAGQLAGAIAALVAVFAVAAWVAVRAFERFGRGLVERSYVVFVGWGLLRSHRAEPDASPGAASPVTARGLGLWAAAAVALVAAGAAGWIAWHDWDGPDGAALRAVAGAGLGAGAAIGLQAARAAVRARRLRRGRHGVTLPNFISMTGVGIGVWAIIVVLAVMNGFEVDLRERILQTNPHVLVEPPPGAQAIAHPLHTSDSLARVEGVRAAEPYAEVEAMVASPYNTSVQLTVRGVLPDGDIARRYARMLVEGDARLLAHPWEATPDVAWRAKAEREPAAHPDRTPAGAIVMPPIPGSSASPAPEEAGGLEGRVYPPILVGSELAASLRVHTGDVIRVVALEGTTGPLGVTPRVVRFVVGGIFHTGIYDFDLKFGVAALPDVQRVFGLGADVNRIELALVDPSDPGPTVTRVRAALGSRGVARDWQSLNRNLFSAMKLEKVAMFFVLGFVILVASFNILGSLSMLVQQKSRDIAILRAMGAPRVAVRRAFLTVGLFVGAIGAACGTALGLATAWALGEVGLRLPREYYLPTVPVHTGAVEVVAAVAAALLISVLATLYPAQLAGRMRPAEGLRYE